MNNVQTTQQEVEDAAISGKNMSFAPVNTVWSVAVLDNNGALGAFAQVPWDFGAGTMAASGYWTGTYAPIAGLSDAFSCQIHGVSGSDTFEVHFVTLTRFIATKNGALYRFGKKL
jgi:hypothetical protein